MVIHFLQKQYPSIHGNQGVHPMSQQPEAAIEQRAVKRRFIACTQSTGRVGKSTVAEGLRIREATGDDTLRSTVFDITRRIAWPAPFTGRTLRNAHVDRWFGRESELMGHLDEVRRSMRQHATQVTLTLLL
jgi:hypothetical protein